MVVTYPELVAEMAKRNLTRTAIAKELGISPRTLYSKLKGKTEFTLSEADAIQSNFFPDMRKDVLFTRADQDTA